MNDVSDITHYNAYNILYKTRCNRSSGTPSPSFFPVKPGKVRDVSHQHERYQETKQRTTRERLETPPASHKHLQSKCPRVLGVRE